VLLARGVPHPGRCQDYPQTAKSRQSNNGALPVTLLWYPKLRDSIDPPWAVGNASLVPGEGPQSTFNCYDYDLESVESLEDIFIYRDPWRFCGHSCSNTAHKRQISQAIPSNERPNASGEEQEDPKAQALEDPPAGPETPRKNTARANPSAQLAVQVDARINAHDRRKNNALSLGIALHLIAHLLLAKQVRRVENAV
jgi:hypothetical protein